MTKNNKNTEISNKNQNNSIIPEMDLEAFNLMQEDAKNYTDDTSPDDLAIPRIKIIQSGSDEKKKNNPKYVKEAEEGDLINTLTNEVYNSEKGLLFVPAVKRIVYLEWKSREKGGGLVKNYGEDATFFLSLPSDENGRKITKEGNEVIKTFDFFGYILDSNNKVQEAVISMQKTQVKKAKNWNSIMRNLTSPAGHQYPIYSAIYKITTVAESNDKGSWHNYKIEFSDWTLSNKVVGKLIYNKAKEFSQNVKEIKVNYESDDNFSSENSDEETM